MAPIFFWPLVIVMTLLLGFLLPKILGALFRIVLYLVAFCLILWFFIYLGLAPSSWEVRARNFFYENYHVETKNHC